MEKLIDRIDFHNNSTPALNETNLNLLSKGLDDLDNRVIQVANMINSGTEVVANPSSVATQTLKKLKVEDITYSIPSGGGGGDIPDITSTTSTSPIVAKGNIRSLKMVGKSEKIGNQIISASGDVVTRSENLAKPISEWGSYVYPTTVGSVLTQSASTRYATSELLVGGVYTVSVKTSGKASILAWGINGNVVAKYQNLGASELEITKTFDGSDYEYVCFAIGEDVSPQIVKNSVYQIQITNSAGATDYVPYGHSIVHTDRPLLSVNTLKNELIVNADGSGTFVERVKEVDLGTLTWTYDSSVPRFYSSGRDWIKPLNNTDTINAMCDKYNIVGYDVLRNNDKVFSVSSNGTLSIKDTSYTDASAFKTSLNGSKLIYELATPTTYTLSPSEVAELLSLKTFGKTYIDCDTEYTIGYFLDNDIASPIADVDAKVDGVASQLSVVADELQSEIDVINSVITKDYSALGLTFSFTRLGNGIKQLNITNGTTSTQINAWTNLFVIDAEYRPSKSFYFRDAVANKKFYFNANGTVQNAEDFESGLSPRGVQIYI